MALERSVATTGRNESCAFPAATVVDSDMQRWALWLIGAALSAVPLMPGQFKPLGIMGSAGWESVPSGLPTWSRVSILAGAYLIEWGPLLAGLLIIFFASRIKR